MCVCVLCTCTLLLAGSVWLVGVCRFRSLDILHKHGTREQARMRQIFAARNKNACEHPLVRTRVRTQRHMLALSLSLSLSDPYAFHANQVVGSNLYLSVVFDIIFKQPSVCNCDFALTKCNVCTKQTWPKPLTVCDTHIRGNWGGMRYCAQYDSYIPFMTGQYNTQKRRLNEYIEIRSGIRTLTTVNKLSVCHARRAQQAC